VQQEAAPESPPPKGPVSIDEGFLAVSVEIVDDDVNASGSPISSRDLAKRFRKGQALPILTGIGQPPARQRFNDGEDVRGATPNVFVINPANFTGAHWHARPRGIVKDDRALIEANNRLLLVVRTRVEREHLLHPVDELLVDRRNAPHFFPATA
jgi:hypothetical protein